MIGFRLKRALRLLLSRSAWAPVTVITTRRRSFLVLAELSRILQNSSAKRLAARLLAMLRVSRRDRVPNSDRIPVESRGNADSQSVGTVLPTSQYGLIVYEGGLYNNIGDDIQSSAAKAFLPTIDHLIPIHTLASSNVLGPPSGRVKVIMNGYFTCYPDAWPPPEWIDPLFVSFHLSAITYPSVARSTKSGHRSAAEILLTGKNLEYFKQHEPIGCRDLATLDRFKAAGVDAYFTGCLTLTLNQSWHRSGDKIYIVDVNCRIGELMKSIPKHLRDQVVIVTHDLPHSARMSQIERFSAAHELLMMYSAARLVVTSRLHCALPCLALGTNVLFVEPRGDFDRLVGIRNLLNSVSQRDIELGRIDWANPPANPSQHLPLRHRLDEICRDFVEG